MKRTITAAIAAATALSLAVVPAQAETPKKPELSASQQQGEKKESSSKISNEDAIDSAIKGDKTKIVESIVKDKDEAGQKKALGPLASSFKSDKSNDWKFGTTFDILLGTGIAALLLVIFNFVKGGIKF
ncbi:hypothetical protein [Corynebacterium meitnerae]|uniref:Secreted protein n=1 Tax=Corynebacterium meitnerae TaxID=2913498 RepID=A0A9X3LT61_9CORY|nr:hypothetical protein [Corynebacterium meitnerae]MCZ9293787.1 hypothetical protein [Corynebacterium meitnerae]